MAKSYRLKCTPVEEQLIKELSTRIGLPAKTQNNRNMEYDDERMIPEEAIKVLRFVLDPREYPNGEKSKCYQYNLRAINKAIGVLERQIPKKPVIRETEDYFGYVKYILCPNCKKVEFGFNQPCFCERCGQAIDWSDNE